MLTESTRLHDFSTLSGMTYLNTAAESIPPRQTGEAIAAYWHDKQKGMKGRDAHFAQVEGCREVTARLLGLRTSEVAFCSCSSEAYNLLASALQLGSNDEVVVTDLDFPAGVTPWLRSPEKPVLRVWNAVDGALDANHLAVLLNERTKLVQVSLVSFYNGHRIDWTPFHDMVRRLAPNALISVDITQAFGRVVLDCAGADILISSTHKWTLGIHGGGIIGIPATSGARLTTHAGGWYHLQNAFDTDRFERAVSKSGAASFSVGMPNFVALYALNASLRYLEAVGIKNIAAHADPLVAAAEAGVRALGVKPMCRWNGSGILAFQDSRSTELHAALENENIHVMHNAGRIRIAVHGYNTQKDIDYFLSVLTTLLRKV
ncbi:aminotransferase class V [Chthoniobacter flavus Ellin428]|uniref:Aminotransferase class V n=1 Tax=Chthoniobacter flavus Ellin428 TaxID=497964 RepID=B4D1L6_9BACT|nr:aminotransferase class V-fold PLP-dependent enzyme [Chthoniobacter flavus]EDY19628.1 aminotransferase class V [Chthoniobacter flavus Ellin428]TCO92865.1 selenocysteine lyase/cysteine desulfurase [Chthoniobacter flavus]